MSGWAWLTIGVVGLLMLAVLAARFIVWIVGTIGRDVSELLELEPWASKPITYRHSLGEAGGDPQGLAAGELRNRKSRG
jgi:hypothetical protein